MSEEQKVATRPGWRTTEFWLALVAVVIGALLSAQVLEGAWSKLAAVALATLTALGYGAGRAGVKKALASGAKALFPLALVFGMVGCGGWQKTTLQTTASIQAGVGFSHDFLRTVCKPSVQLCRAAGRKTLADCPELKRCDERRQPALDGLDSAMRLVRQTLVAIDLKDRPTAMNAITAALESYRNVIGELEKWGVDVEKWRL